MVRIFATAILFGALLGGATLAAAEEMPALARFELPLDVNARFDGAGRLQLLLHEEPLLEVELLLEGGYVEQPSTVREHALGTEAGARLDHAELVSRSLQEGMRGGLRGSNGDDDGDGSFDEDPVDGADNDGDGAVDEDFAAIGTSMRSALADLSPLGLDGAKLRGELYHWGYYHLDAALFWNARIENDPAQMRLVEGATAARIDSPYRVELLEQRIRPHSSVGRVPELRLVLPRLRVELEDGSRLYVGLLRLDGLRPSLMSDDADRFDVVWPANSGTQWPLAVLVARTEQSLLYLAGQAMLTYDRVGAARDASQYWSVPPLCARCQNPRIPEARASLTEQSDRLRLQMSYDGAAEPETIAHEGLKVAGVNLARFLVAAGSSGATYEIPLRSAPARQIVDAAAQQEWRPEVWLVTGKAVRPETVEVEIDPRLAADSSSRVADQDDLPSYLSPRLVQSWPNPFRETTTIEVQVPATLGEAFELDDQDRQRFDLQAAPPFGADPSVTVRVFNVSGQLIRVLEEATHGPGSFSVSWDGNDLSGRAVAAGAYYVNVEMGEWSVTRRVLRLKP